MAAIPRVLPRKFAGRSERVSARRAIQSSEKFDCYWRADKAPREEPTVSRRDLQSMCVRVIPCLANDARHGAPTFPILFLPVTTSTNHGNQHHTHGTICPMPLTGDRLAQTRPAGQTNPQRFQLTYARSLWPRPCTTRASLSAVAPHSFVPSGRINICRRDETKEPGTRGASQRGLGKTLGHGVAACW